MKLYEVIEYFDGPDTDEISYGLFSTHEKANELIKMFEDYDGFGIRVDHFEIREVEIIPDKISDRVLWILESCKRNKEIYEEIYGAD